MEKAEIAVRKKMCGVWTLIQSEFRTQNGNSLFPLGNDAQGELIITETGYLTAQLMLAN